ncbi:hypothetical protein FRX31_034175 [Thalictrum thalictroides]|uniref:Uncharacterized protein n=1 Tax=Thalictrum thalictroides TaxID=46969 RepID=A0A7J6UUI4_THATH|nr:hypothetical protein FRX31_034175 [Thalictrum thalictroides]
MATFDDPLPPAPMAGPHTYPQPGIQQTLPVQPGHAHSTSIHHSSDLEPLPIQQVITDSIIYLKLRPLYMSDNDQSTKSGTS